MMKRYIYSLLLILIFGFTTMNAQRVGLVLSGGGAKGMTHIGVIRALEENDIPIDYITGTSMGAIIGSLYAMGYSPDDMEALISSDDFKRWYNAEIEENYIYYFKKNLPTPEFLSVHFSLKGDKGIKSQFLPTSVVNPIQMNLAFLELFAQSTALCQGDFDHLFIPFRCVASDVYNKKELVLSKGDLGDAVRASMSFPFMFKPIKMNDVLVYDGGIYNNFPTDVMRKDFNPDLVIGSVVAQNTSKPDEGDLMGQIETMVMQKTNYDIPAEEGILLKFEYKDVSLMDFDKIKLLEKIGYDRTMRSMDSIKSRVSRRSNQDNLRMKRLVYRSNLPPFRFRNIEVEGGNTQQKEYVRREIQRDEGKEFTYEDFKRSYFRLLSDNIISEIIPHAVYNAEDETYDLKLQVKLENNLSLRVGGNISSSNSNQMYFGIAYQDLNYNSREFALDGQAGKVYNNVQLMARFDFPTIIPTSYRVIASFSSLDYFKKDKLFSGYNNKPAMNSKEEYFAKVVLALPFLSKKRAEFGMGGAILKDRYFQSSVIDFDKDRYDKSTYKLLGGSISFNGSTLNARQYATQGSSEALVGQVFTGMEYFTAGASGMESYRHQHSWIQFSYMKEKYHRLSSRWTLGWYGKALYSSQNFSENYTATMLNACEFSPISHSMITYNEAFRANQYVAVGIRPIYQLSKLFHVRGELYGFMPIFPIRRLDTGKAAYGEAFSKVEYIAETSIVCTLPFGSIRAYANNYSSPRREWNVGLTLGWQLFNYRFKE